MHYKVFIKYVKYVWEIINNLDKMHVKLFLNFMSNHYNFDYLLISQVTNYACSELKFGVLWTGSESENKQKKLDVRVEERMCNLLIYVVFME